MELWNEIKGTDSFERVPSKFIVRNNIEISDIIYDALMGIDICYFLKPSVKDTNV